MTKFNNTKFEELAKYSPNYLQLRNGETDYLTYLVTPKKTMVSRRGSEVYTEGVNVQVKIDRPRGSEWVQIHRDVGHWVKGNSHKAYDSLDLLLEDFDIIQGDYVQIKPKAI